MKRKLFLLLCALLTMIGVTQVKAYTVSDLTSAGWTQVTDLTSVTLADNYFMFVDAGTSLYSVTNARPGTDSKPTYQALQNPTADWAQVWKLSKDAQNNYFIQSNIDGWYFISAANAGQGWTDKMSSESANGGFTFEALADNKYSIKGVFSNGFVGPWNDDGAVNLNNNLHWGALDDDYYEELACNKSDAQSPDFYIYYISRTSYDAARRSSATLETEGWSKVTATSGLGKAGYFYTFLDLSETSYETGLAMIGTNGRPKYTSVADPVANTEQLWTTEPHGAGYALKNVGVNKYFYLATAATWNTGFTPNIDASYTDFVATVSEGKWTLSNSLNTSEFVGRWSNSPYAPGTNEDIAANKAADAGKRQFFIYSIPTIAGVAEELPGNGDMTADTWYYINIPATADNYTATATALANIVYTSDGATLVKNGSTVTNQFTETDNSLTATRYYVKSSTGNNLVIGVASYTYSVSAATADKAYIQPSQTVTVSFTVSTNDPGAELAQNYSGVTFDGVAINVTPEASGFTFTLPANLEAGVPHTLYIPAGAIGYEVGSTYNAEQSIVLNATAIYDGIYYLKVENESAAKGKYLSRGNANGVHATIDFYGIPVQVVTNGNNETTLQAYDSKQYYVHAGQWNCNANGETSANGLYTITLNGGKYRIHNNSMEAGRYFKYNDNALGNVVLDVYDDGTGSNSGPIIDWSVETLSEHNAVLGTYTTKNYANVIEDAGLEVAPGNFVAYLASNYAAKDKTSSVGTAKITNAAGSWAWTGVREQGGQPAYNNAAEAWQATGSWSQTIENLPSGIYKVTVNAFERDGGWSLCNTLGGEGYKIVTSYFKANDELVQLKSWYSEKTGTNNPNSMAEAATAFNNDKYKNEVYTYVADGGSGTGSLTITIAKPGFIGDNWLLFNNVYLTYYDSSVSSEDAAAILEEATTAMNSPMKPSLYQALATANSAFEGSQTVPNYNALRTAIDNCATSIASYAAMNTNYLERITSLIDNNNVYSSTASGYVEYAAYKSKYDNYKDAQTEDIDNATANSLNAYNGDKGTRPVDLVLMPSWTIGGGATGNKFYQNTWSDEGAGDGTNFLLPFYEYWVSGEKVLDATTLQATQTGLTAKGIYKVSAWVRVQESTARSKIANGITMQVGEGPSVDVSAGEKIGETNRYIGEYTAYGQADNDGNLVIKFVVAEGSNISWLAFKNLNYEEATAANLKVADGKLGTFIAPFDITLPENVKAYSATATETEVKLTKIAEGGEELAAGTPVIIYGDGDDVDKTFYGVPTVTENQTVGALTGILDDSNKTISSGKYVLQTQSDVQAFYKLAGSATGKLNRCFVSAGVAQARLVISIDEEDPTAINAIEAAEAETGALKDGKYLIGNKVVLVKNGVKYGANGQILK